MEGNWREELAKLPKERQAQVTELAQKHMQLGRKPSEAFQKALEEIREVG